MTARFSDMLQEPPLPERPANCGFDIPFFGEVRIMVGRDDEGGVLRPLVVDPLVVSTSVPFLSALPSLAMLTDCCSNW